MHTSKSKTELPENMTLQEASEFWDAHSFLEFDDIEEAHFEVDLKGEKHYFAVEKELAKMIHQAAQQRGISSETLVNLWLTCKLNETA
ncbi:MAG: CopG family antitoxin [bacterium]